MSQLLQPLSVFDFTPPASPNKLSHAMNWLTRTPSGVPLPPSPTKLREDSDDDGKSTLSAESSTLTQSNFTKAMRSLQKRSSTFSLQPKASSSSLKATSLDTPQREFSNWFSRPSLARAITPAPPVSELGDHFARSLPVYQDKQAELRRRRVASRKRVQGLRAYLGTAVNTKGFVYNPQEASANTSYPPRVHQRYDSGVQEHTDNAALHESLKQDDTHSFCEEPQTAEHTFDQDFLQHALFRLRCQPPLQFPCAGCNQTHEHSTQPTASPTWLLMSCRHFVHSECFSGLRDAPVPDADACMHCALLRRRLRQLSREEMEAGYRRLLDATPGTTYE